MSFLMKEKKCLYLEFGHRMIRQNLTPAAVFDVITCQRKIAKCITSYHCTLFYVLHI